MAEDQTSQSPEPAPNPPRRKYVRAVGPRLRVVLFIIFGLVALLGADRVGTPILDNTHRPGAFRLVPPDFENAPTVALDRKVALLRLLPIRRFRPPVRAKVQTSGPTNAPTDGSVGPLPISLRCSVGSGRIRVAVGPWRASGNWWESGAWQREEWDVEGRHGAIYRLACEPDGWKVEGVLD